MVSPISVISCSDTYYGVTCYSDTVPLLTITHRSITHHDVTY